MYKFCKNAFKKYWSDININICISFAKNALFQENDYEYHCWDHLTLWLPQQWD